MRCGAKAWLRSPSPSSAAEPSSPLFFAPARLAGGPAAEIDPFMDIREGEDRRDQPGEPSRPSLGVRLGRDQILADFDQSIGEAARRRYRVDRVAGQGAVIGLVIADRL